MLETDAILPYRLAKNCMRIHAGYFTDLPRHFEIATIFCETSDKAWKSIQISPGPVRQMILYSCN